MPKFAANLSLMFTEVAFLDRFAAAAEAGFKAVEFLFPYSYEPRDIQARLVQHDLKLVLFNISPGNWEKGDRGLTALAGREDEFRCAVDDALAYADALQCPRLHAMAGLLDGGAHRDVYVANLKHACASAKDRGVDILVEPINTDDMPGYFLTDTETARSLIEDVGYPNLGLQFDLYHRHKMQGGVFEAIETFAPYTRHYQCAAPRDRGEPDRQDLDYGEVFARIDNSGFDGWIGCEYRPRGTTVAGLSWRQMLVG